MPRDKPYPHQGAEYCHPDCGGWGDGQPEGSIVGKIDAQGVFDTGGVGEVVEAGFDGGGVHKLHTMAQISAATRGNVVLWITRRLMKNPYSLTCG